MKSIQAQVDEALRAVCPVDAVSFGKINDKATWVLQFAPTATDPQKAAAQAVIDAFDVGAAGLPPTPDQIESQVQALLNSGTGPDIDWPKLIKAKFISDLAWRLGVAPGALTGPQLTAERNRIAAIYKALP